MCSGFSEIQGAIEAVLFSVGDAIKIDKLAFALNISKDELIKEVENMVIKYDEQNRGITIIRLQDSFQMATKKQYYDYIKKISTKIKDYTLTDVLIETLAIIAYKQPITKSMVESIRGVNSNHAVNKLVEYKLVEEVGRMDGAGRPILFGTTKDFLRGFGIEKMDELPTISDEVMNKIKGEVRGFYDTTTEDDGE